MSQPVLFAHREIFGLPIGSRRQTDQSTARWRCSGRRRCGYPTWTTKKVDWMEYEREQQRGRRRRRKPERERSPRAWWCYPMSKGCSVRVKHHISTAMRLHTTIRHLLVHPKDKIQKEKSAGESTRSRARTVNNHTWARPDANSVQEWQSTRRRYRQHGNKNSHTRAEEDITERVAQVNDNRPRNTTEPRHRLGGAKILEKEEDHKTRLIKDSIWIRTTPQNCST